MSEGKMPSKFLVKSIQISANRLEILRKLKAPNVIRLNELDIMQSRIDALRELWKE